MPRKAFTSGRIQHEGFGPGLGRFRMGIDYSCCSGMVVAWPSLRSNERRYKGRPVLSGMIILALRALVPGLVLGFDASIGWRLKVLRGLWTVAFSIKLSQWIGSNRRINRIFVAFVVGMPLGFEFVQWPTCSRRRRHGRRCRPFRHNSTISLLLPTRKTQRNHWTLTL